MTFHAGLRMCVYCVDVILLGYTILLFVFSFIQGLGLNFVGTIRVRGAEFGDHHK